MNIPRVVKTIAPTGGYWQRYFSGLNQTGAWKHGKHSLDEIENGDGLGGSAESDAMLAPVPLSGGLSWLLVPFWLLAIVGIGGICGVACVGCWVKEKLSSGSQDALVPLNHTAADRFSTVSFGSLRPVEANDTLEGRARNRGGELTRE